jgi:hypothetical protein
MLINDLISFHSYGVGGSKTGYKNAGENALRLMEEIPLQFIRPTGKSVVHK